MARQQKKSTRRGVGQTKKNSASERAVIASFGVPPPKAVSEYASTLAHPFDGPEGVGIPRWPSVATEKQTVRAFGYVNCSTTTGVGFVAANHAPLSSITANVANVYVTDASFLGTAITTNTATTGVTGIQHNGTISSADYTSFLVKTRTVACGLRIRYVGRSDEMAGSVIIAHSPYDESLTGLNAATLRQWESTATVPVSKEWVSVSWTPANVDDFAFQGDSVSPSPFAQGQAASLGFLITGTTGAFEWEYILHYEMSGNLARGASYNESHSEAVEHVNTVVKKQDKGLFSQLLNRYGGRALELGKKLAHSYYAKHKGELFKRGMALAGRAAPLALTL